MSITRLDRLSRHELAAYADGTWLAKGQRPHVMSSTGVVHLLTGEHRLGLITTRCGAYVDRGWAQLPTQADLSCATCIALGRHDRMRRQGRRTP